MNTAEKISTTSVRLDKWLWAARFYKTRSIARDMVQSGKVSYNGKRSKPSKVVEVGAIITLRQGQDDKEVELLIISEHRRGAPEAQLLYQETVVSIEKREKNSQLRKLHALESPHPDKRPDKKQRRKIIQFKNQ